MITDTLYGIALANDETSNDDANRVDFDSLDIPSLWAEWLDTHSRYSSQSDFVDFVRTLVTDDDGYRVDEIRFCDDCSDAALEDEFFTTGDDTTVCESCRDDYWTCEQCSESFRETTTVNGDTEVCESCLERHYSWCDDCEAYYSDDYADEHDHSNGFCDCEAPAQSFKIRNDGFGMLANDEQTSIMLAAGVISDEGMAAITSYLCSLSYECADDDERRALRTVAYSVSDLDATWQTKQGNFTKRLSRMAYKACGVKLSAEAVSQVGNLASAHSKGVSMTIAVTRALNGTAEEFGNDESCWWTSYAGQSRCALKSNGGFGLRTFDAHGWTTGRAWIMPLRETDTGKLTPTFDSETPAAFVVFNGYGDLEGYAPARIMAHLSGMTYRKIEFRCDPMYVNSEAGYLIAPEDLANEYTDGSLSLYTDQHSNLFHSEG